MKIRNFLHYIKDRKALAIFSLVFALLSVAAKMSIPYVSGLAINQLKGGNYDISVYIVIIACLLTVGAIFKYVFEIMVAYLGQSAVKKMRDEAYASINNVSISYIDSKKKGDLLLCLTNDIENVQTGLIAGAVAFYEGIVEILITIGFMFVLNYALALVVLCLTPISIFVSRFVSNRNSKYYKDQNAKTGALTAYSLESITNLEATNAYCQAEAKESEYDALNKTQSLANFKAVFAVSWINPSTRLINNSIYAILIMLGSIIYLTQPSWIPSFTIGALSSFLTYATQFMTPFNEISNVASEISYAVASFNRVDALVHAEKDVDEGTMPLNSSIETLKASHVDFAYDETRKIIDDFDIDIYKGHKIALVGPTGCGKTTVINLLLRFYDPQSGSFIINGTDSRLYPKKELRKHIGMVLQETWLFKGSIRDNIAYAKPDATMDEIVEAAKKAHADSFIRQMKDGYDTIVSSTSGLSTGQKQLLCVARIMLLEPEIIVLDEATSNIDLRTELLLSSSFDELMKGKTSLVVAHRLSTIKNADLIIVLKDGVILEYGNFEELLSKGGFFKGLYDSQFA